MIKQNVCLHSRNYIICAARMRFVALIIDISSSCQIQQAHAESEALPLASKKAANEAVHAGRSPF